MQGRPLAPRVLEHGGSETALAESLDAILSHYGPMRGIIYPKRFFGRIH